MMAPIVMKRNVKQLDRAQVRCPSCGLHYVLSGFDKYESPTGLITWAHRFECFCGTRFHPADNRVYS